MDKHLFLRKFAQYTYRHSRIGMCPQDFAPIQYSLCDNTIFCEKQDEIICTLQQFVNNLFGATICENSFHLCISLLSKMYDLCSKRETSIIRHMTDIFDDKYSNTINLHKK
jgi:hypothetical protein